MQFTPIRWAVDGLIAEGVNLLAGRPKLGKSCSPSAALAVATGGQFLGVPVDQGPVIYLALEDSAWCIQARLEQASRRRHLARRPHVSLSLPQDGCRPGLEALQAEMRDPCPRLIVVDTFQKIRQRPTGGGNAYAEDYDAVGVLQQLALEIQAAARIDLPHAETR